MEAQLIAILIMVPITMVFIFAGIREYRRFKSEGRASYGLVYDEETGTTHVTGIAEDEDSFDPEDFDPRDYSVSESRNETDEKKT